MFKRIILCLTAALCGLATAWAQDYRSLSEIIPSLEGEGCVKSEYVMKVKGSKTPEIVYRGVLYWQDGAFRIEGDGYGIYCDKVHIWTVDSVAKEIVREAAVPIDELIPNTSGSDGKEIEVRTTPDGKKISEIFLTMKNGTTVTILVPSMNFIDSRPSEFFSYDDSSVPEGFILTVLD